MSCLPPDSIIARVQAAVQDRPLLDPSAEQEQMARAGVEMTTLADADYPALLRTVDGAPAGAILAGNTLA